MNKCTSSLFVLQYTVIYFFRIEITVVIFRDIIFAILCNSTLGNNMFMSNGASFFATIQNEIISVWIAKTWVISRSFQNYNPIKNQISFFSPICPRCCYSFHIKSKFICMKHLLCNVVMITSKWNHLLWIYASAMIHHSESWILHDFSNKSNVLHIFHCDRKQFFFFQFRMRRNNSICLLVRESFKDIATDSKFGDYKVK